ncbi:MAG TPA: 1-acyl-sn-glycerol-3-phosphate acyltransferase [Alphaproteobacteria bacterium]
MIRFLRSLIFNICFYGYTAIACFVLMWAFVLPRKAALFAVMLYFKGIIPIERYIMGIDYHLMGQENLPKDGRYILAMKHQSAYETLKLLPLFGKIAVVFKRELSWIPFWGWYMLKTGMIPIDRGARNAAMTSMIEGGRRVMDAGRPIVIFPQGTRTRLNETPADKPYKFGAIKLAQALQVPIVPVALNSGVFWGRKAFKKQSGIVDFKILPPISPDQTPQAMMEQLQTVLETESDLLVKNAKVAS